MRDRFCLRRVSGGFARHLAVAGAIAWAVFGGDRPAFAREPVDLNNATPEEVRSLPVPPEVAEAIIDHLRYQGPFKSFYQLREVPGVEQSHLDALRPLVAILPRRDRGGDLERLDEIYDRLSRLASSEGANEALIDAYVDQLRVPLSLDRVTVEELQALPGVSPIDAAAIVRHLEGGGHVRSARDLRRVPGLSHYGWRSARDYFRYDAAPEARLSGDLQVRVTRPLLDTDVTDLFHEDYEPRDDDLDDYDEQQVVDAYTLLGLDRFQPATTTKLRLRWGTTYEAGVITHRRAMEEDLAGTAKFYAGVRDREWGPIRLHRLILGNFSVALGQGLILENTDFFRPRKSGLTYDKRTQGILGDISRTHQHAFRGVAADASWNRLRMVGFWSYRVPRDVILGQDGTVRALVTLDPRLDSWDFPDSSVMNPDHPQAYPAYLQKDGLNETTWGGSIRYSFAPGTHVGITGYESLYDRFFRPTFDGVVNRTPREGEAFPPGDDTDEIQPIDSEFLTANELDGRYRRVIGGEGQVVWENLLGQVEYGKQLGAGDAIIATAFAQWSNLNLLLSYRDYDVDYGNPYDRAFSEKERYDGTILEDPFRLTNPLMSQVFLNSAQPAPERGWYGSTRYRISRWLLTTVDYSTWLRKSDGSTFKRIVPRLQLQPTWPVRLEWRHKWQSRNEEVVGASVQVSQTVEDRFRLRLFLSNRNSVELLYHIGHTRWPGRGRLAGVVDGGPAHREADPDEGSPLQGSVTEPTTALATTVSHKLTDRMSIRGGATAFRGFFWNWEDTEFLVMDGDGARVWVSVWDRLSDRLSLYLKTAWQRHNPTTYRDARRFNSEFEFNSRANDAPLEMAEATSFRLQMDYAW